MDSYLSLPISERKVQQLVDDAKDFVYGLGMVVRSPKKPLSHDAIVHAPFTLFPSPILRSQFNQACQVQTDMNLLFHEVANDPEFLEQCLNSVVKVDEFTRRLWNIYETVRREGIAQPITLALNRADYMIGSEDDAVEVQKTADGKDDVMNSAYSFATLDLSNNLRQIEFNTMSASFAGLSQNLTAYHRYFLDRLNISSGSQHELLAVPTNKAAAALADTIVEAWHLYDNPKAVVLFLVTEVERNIYDQRSLEYHIYENHSEVRVIRRTLSQIRDGGDLTPSKQLMIDNLEVAIVYQRSCYIPSHFTSDADWETKLMIERSLAIVCPNIAYHLAGTKKVQQVLSQPGVIEKFIKDADAVHRIRNTFTEMFSLDMNHEGDANVVMALKNPALYVLKPQREGGGNNIFGEAVREELLRMKNLPERASYILMRRVHPLVYRNYVVRAEKPAELMQMVSELGIYGSLVAKGDEIILNKQQGYLLRTKKVGVDEGGVATGYSVLDSPFVVDTWPLGGQTTTLDSF